MAAVEQEPRNLDCQVSDVTLMGEDVYRVRLLPPGGEMPAFNAGQYLSVNLPGTDPAWFSIASAPGAEELVLHVQVPAVGDTAADIIHYLRTERQVQVTVPFGEACIAGLPEQPLLLVVAGTGFAQAKSVVEYLMANRSQQPVFLYWGVRRHEDMYLRAMAEEWQRDWRDFHFRPVVGDDDDNAWAGHHDQLVRAVKADGHPLDQVKVLASGSPAMVYSVMDTLVAAGMPEGNFLSDVLQYAPR